MRKRTFKGGIHLHQANEKKALTSNSEIRYPQSPEVLCIPLNQQLGKASLPIVTVGDEVLKGQKIAEGDGPFSAALHAPVSGVIESIDSWTNDPTGNRSKSILIRNDFKDAEIAKLSRSHEEALLLTPTNITDIMKECGIVGLGGATFPTPIKYTSGKPCDTVILNGIECEPYNTADYAIMKNHPKEVVRGLKYMMIASGAKEGYVCIEDNKMDIYETFLAETASDPSIKVALFQEKYPQGAEKQLITALTGKEVPYGGLPIAIGVIVNNVGTAKAVADAVEEGLPLTHHYLTITGDVTSPHNWYVPIGIKMKDLLTVHDLEHNKVLLAGGLMMGKAMYDADVPITKGINAVILKRDLPQTGPELPCVRCSSCVDHCPAFLSPTLLARLVKKNQWDTIEDYGLSACIECGCCSYVCPSHIPLLDYIRHGKIEMRRR